MEQERLDDLSLKCCALTDRISRMRDAYFRAVPEICAERACLITQYHRDKRLLDERRKNISILEKAKVYRQVLENRTPIVMHTQAYDSNRKPFQLNEVPLFAGSTTSKFKGVPIYPEFLGLAIWPELRSISERESNPLYLSFSEAETFNRRVFPYWMKKNIHELTRSTYCRHEGGPSDPEKEWTALDLMERLVFFLASKSKCISHTIPDFSKVLKWGLQGIIGKTKKKISVEEDGKKREFYVSVCDVLEGIKTYSKNLAAEAEKLAMRESNGTRREELLELAKIHRRVPMKKARTFRQGLTIIWVCWTAIHLENPNIGLSLGRLDQVLYDLFKSDIKNGVIDMHGAVELLCAFFLKIGDHVPCVPEVAEQLFGGSGSNQAVTIGGVDKGGENAVNELTYAILRATELMKLRDPNLNARYYPDVNSEEYLMRLCEVNVNTGATPAIHNDRAVIEALKARDDTVEQARDYGIIGCVEPGSNGRFYGHSSAILLNLTSVLELTLFQGKHRNTGERIINRKSGDPIQSFSDFKEAFEKQTRWLIGKATELNNNYGETHQRFYPTPILSAFFEGPMDNGQDLIEGGATINASGATIIGLADVADSLSAIEKVVFNEKRVSFEDLLDALRKDFKGKEDLRKRLANPAKTPKYGNDDTRADANVLWIVELLDSVFKDQEHYRGGRYRVGYWTMTNHAGFGRLMKAMPNGRKAGENFASGITPVSGVTPILSNALNSAAGLPARCLTNGVALNLKYSPENGERKKMLDNFAATIKAYFDDVGGQRDGGMEIQFNIIDNETLKNAYKYPGKAEHQELLVRVSGYTAYFKDLNSQMQKEIIDRTEYVLSSGRMRVLDPIPLKKKRT